MPEDLGAEIEGLAQLRKVLAKASSASGLQNEFKAEEKKIAQRVAQASTANALSLEGVPHHFAKRITGKVSRSGAAVGPTKKANAAFWGTKKRTGANEYSYSRRKSAHPVPSRLSKRPPGRSAARAIGFRRGADVPNQPRWVGNRWQAGVRGQGPIAINEAVADLKPQIIEWYGDAIKRVVSPSMSSD